MDVQFRHYKASLEIFTLKPSKESREFAELVHFIAQAGSSTCAQSLLSTSFLYSLAFSAMSEVTLRL